MLIRSELLLSYFLIKLLSFICIIVFILLAVASVTAWERKILGLIQRRKGPNVIGYCGVLQPFADGIKLLLKECVVPSRANKYLFLFAPTLALTLAFIVWIVLPLDVPFVQSDVYYEKFDFYKKNLGEFGLKFRLGSLLPTDVGLLFVLAILSLNTYPVILGGWASNSKYAFLGALRASAQMISYEIAMSLTILPICVLSGSSSLEDILLLQNQTLWNIFTLPISFILFFICVLAETYRTPFDFTEAEGELVSGFNVEYSSMGFALFFLGEYMNIIFMCAFMSVLFFGGLKVYVTILLLFLIILLRGTLPRYRYDQLMRLGWRIIMPISVFYLVLISFVFFFFF